MGPKSDIRVIYVLCGVGSTVCNTGESFHSNIHSKFLLALVMLMMMCIVSEGRIWFEDP